jgi:hypothetical protein
MLCDVPEIGRDSAELRMQQGQGGAEKCDKARDERRFKIEIA